MVAKRTPFQTVILGECLQEGLNQKVPLPPLQFPPLSPILLSVEEDHNSQLFQRQKRTKEQHCLPSRNPTQIRLKKLQEGEDLSLHKGKNCDSCWGLTCTYES